jgi:class 3 adenylate cyclase
MDPSVAPTRPFALVFTDIVGSSAAKRALNLGADANARDRAYLQGIQTRHLRLVRECVAAHHGTEIMTIGDAFFLTFEDVRDALLCAAEIQINLKAHAIMTSSGPLRLRIGIHVGTPEFFENSWHGTDVDTAARVESAGAPQQILLSAAAREAAGHMDGIAFRPLGTFALKGVGNVSLWDADYDSNGLRIPAAVSLETIAHERRMKRVFRIGYVLVAVLVIAAGYFGYQRQHKPVIGEREPIILADLTNKTGEPVFDSTITPAITIALQQSPILNLVSHSHLRQSMKYLGKPADDPVTPDLARQIGQREGIKAFLSGEVDKLGSSYVITLNAQSTATGDTLATEQTPTRTTYSKPPPKPPPPCALASVSLSPPSRSSTHPSARPLHPRWRRSRLTPSATSTTRKVSISRRQKATTARPSPSTPTLPWPGHAWVLSTATPDNMPTQSKPLIRRLPYQKM